MDRTLYLTESSTELTIRRDGPSIWITGARRAGQRVPARLIGRLVVIGNINVEAAIITLFAEHGVPMVFLGRDGTEWAVVLPCCADLPEHYAVQRMALVRPGRDQILHQWSQEWRQAVQRSMIKDLYPWLSLSIRRSCSEQTYEELIEYLRPEDLGKWNAVRGFALNLSLSVVVERLIASGLDPRVGILHRGRECGLALDIAGMLEAVCDVISLGVLHSRVTNPAGDKRFASHRLTAANVEAIVAAFEGRRRAYTDLADAIISELIRKLGERRDEKLISDLL